MKAASMAAFSKKDDPANVAETGAQIADAKLTAEKLDAKPGEAGGGVLVAVGNLEKFKCET